MHLRRALLLFAIVLGLAAVAASVSRPRDHSTPPPTVSTTTNASPTVEPRSTEPVATSVTFDADRPKAHRIDAGQAATVYVRVSEPGQVSIDALGMTDVAEPTTPAEFDVFTRTPGRYPILFQPSGSAEAIEAGTLVVE